MRPRTSSSPSLNRHNSNGTSPSSSKPSHSPPYSPIHGISGSGSSSAYPIIPKPTIKRFIASPRTLLLPSVRLKTALYTLIILVIGLIVLALNAAKISNPKISDVEVNKTPSHYELSDTGDAAGIARGQDIHIALVDEGSIVGDGTDGEKVEIQVKKDEELQRSFEEPDFELLSGLQPHEIGCDVPLDGDEKEQGKLVFLGIFSSMAKKERRDLYRKVVIPDFPKSLVTVKFILGLPPFPDKPVSKEALDRSSFLREVEAEAAEHGDMVILPMVDNIDLGKTHEYLKWVAKEYAGKGRVKDRPRFIMKADDDTLLVMPNVFSAFKDKDCSRNIYWGTSAGRSHYFGDYFRGLAYAMSWPLVSWIGSADMPLAHTVKIEDARTGQWLRHLDPVLDPIDRIDMGWTMGDWNQLDVGVETVALHWLKLDEWVTEQHDRLLKIWSEADRPYTQEHGVEPRLSIAKGRMTPEGAQKEHERQKELGWDVEGNLDQG